MTLRGRRRSVQTAVQTMSSVVLWREPPCEPKTLGDRIHDTRSMRGYAAGKVKEALPQQASVRELGRTYNALFLHKIEASTKISCTF